MANPLKRELALDAVDMAIYYRRRPAIELIHRSERAIQYILAKLHVRKFVRPSNRCCWRCRCGFVEGLGTTENTLYAFPKA
jgi:hypothetical protein